MKKVIIGVAGLRSLLLLICITALLLADNTWRVSAKEADTLPYLIKVNRACNTITIYTKNVNGEYTEPVKAMACSVGKGTKTITGTFQTKEKFRWKSLMGDVWGQYATRIVGGILFHSVYYYKYKDPATLATAEYNKLGSAASHGCIRLTVGDAKWIYDNCPVGTTVIIYDDKKSPGPLGKPSTITLPASVRWDPTDPSNDNPFKDKIPVITGAKDMTIAWGDKVDLLTGVKAKSYLGADITAKLKLEGEVDSNKPGVYQVTYSVIDDFGKETKQTVTVKVIRPLINPELRGIRDRVVNADTIIDEAFAMAGVEVYCSEEKLDNSLIHVTIEEKNIDEYLLTYQIVIDGQSAAEGLSTVYVDREAPKLTGVKDIYLEAGEIPDEEYLLDGITVSDNYSLQENIHITASVVQNPEGGYLAVYEAVDEAGNSSKEQAKIIN